MDANTLFSGLESPKSSERISTLRLIRRSSDEALKVCSASGKDLVGKLLKLCGQFTNSAERWEFIFTALGYADERTAKLAMDVFVSSVENKFMVMAANRINKMSEKDKVAFLSPLLLADNNKNRSRLCANLLAGNGLMDTKTAIRAAVISDRRCTLPLFNSSTADVWISELQGPYMQSVRKKFLTLSDTSSDLLLTKWDSLSEGLKDWVLSELIYVNSAGFEVMINTVLQTESSAKVLLSALDCVLSHGSPNLFSDAVNALVKHGDDIVRAKAVLCCGDTELLKTMLEKDETAQVSANIITKLAVSRDAFEMLTRCFSDKRWQVRAAAAKSMIKLAPASIPLLQELFESSNVDARTAAVKCLCDLGMQKWVETKLKQTS